MDKKKYINDLFTSFTSLNDKNKDNLSLNILLTLNVYDGKIEDIKKDANELFKDNDKLQEFTTFLDNIKSNNPLNNYKEWYEVFVKYIIDDYASTEIEKRISKIKEAKLQVLYITTKIGIEKIIILQELQKDIKDFKDILTIISNEKETILNTEPKFLIEDLATYLQKVLMKLLDYYKKTAKLFKPDVLTVKFYKEDLLKLSLPDFLKKFTKYSPTVISLLVKNIKDFNIDELKDVNDVLKDKYKEATDFIQYCITDTPEQEKKKEEEKELKELNDKLEEAKKKVKEQEEEQALIQQREQDDYYLSTELNEAKQKLKKAEDELRTKKKEFETKKENDKKEKEKKKDDKYAIFKKKIEDEAEKKKIKTKLLTFDKLLNTNTGEWKEDILKDKEYKDTLIELQKKYIELLKLLDYTKVEVKKDYKELHDFYERLKSINTKITKKQKIPEEDLNIIDNFDELIKKFQEDDVFKSDETYKAEIVKIKDVYNTLRKTDLSPEKIKEFKEKNEEQLKKTGKEQIRRANVIYFDDYTSIFSMILYYITMVTIVLLFSIVILSLLSFFKLIYEIVRYIIAMFVNEKMTKGLSIDYLNKNIINCTKDNLEDDLFFIIFEQRQNITLFNLGAYIIYLLLFYLLLYIIINIYAKYMKQEFSGNLNNIDVSGVFLPIIGIIILYSFLHLALYKILYKNYVYIPYKVLSEKEKKVDEKIAEYILIYSDSTDTNKQILIDKNFFDIMYDLTRIEELNTIFANGIKNNDKTRCIEQKLIIYDIYMYMREYVVFDNKMQEKFIDYCTTTADQKPLYDNTKNKITFLSLLNNSEVKMLKKYHEELAFFNEIPDDKIEYYNNLNKSISSKIKEINLEIITHNKTLIPFFITIVYIILIVLFNLIIFYIIMNFVLQTPKNGSSNPFNYYFIQFAFFIKYNVYDKIINLFSSLLFEKNK